MIDTHRQPKQAAKDIEAQQVENLKRALARTIADALRPAPAEAPLAERRDVD